jgi:hypothetical protein
MTSMNIKIRKKHNSKNTHYDNCQMAESTCDVTVAGGFVDISFTSGTVNKASDFIIEIPAEDFAPLCLEAIKKGMPKQLHDYSKDQLRQAYEDKIKEECGI